MANILKKVLHNTSSKSPQDMVLRAAQTTEKLTDTATERQQEELARYLSQMKVLGLPRSLCPLCSAYHCLLANFEIRKQAVGQFRQTGECGLSRSKYCFRARHCAYEDSCNNRRPCMGTGRLSLQRRLRCCFAGRPVRLGCHWCWPRSCLCWTLRPARMLPRHVLYLLSCCPRLLHMVDKHSSCKCCSLLCHQIVVP